MVSKAGYSGTKRFLFSPHARAVFFRIKFDDTAPLKFQTSSNGGAWRRYPVQANTATQFLMLKSEVEICFTNLQYAKKKFHKATKGAKRKNPPTKSL